MAKAKKIYVCNQCGYEAPKWYGKCPGCDSWNSFSEEVKAESTTTFNRAVTLSSNGKPKSIGQVKSSEYERFNTGIGELNRVIGGGLVKGSLTFI